MESTSCKKTGYIISIRCEFKFVSKNPQTSDILFVTYLYEQNFHNKDKYAESRSPWRVPEDNEKYLVVNPLFITQLS